MTAITPSPNGLRATQIFLMDAEATKEYAESIFEYSGYSSDTAYHTAYTDLNLSLANLASDITAIQALLVTPT